MADEQFLSNTALKPAGLGVSGPILGMEETVSADGVTATYRETDTERQLLVRTGGTEATVAQNTDGYAMLAVRDGDGNERERYYGFDMALDHVAELVGIEVHDIPVPEPADGMGM